MTMYLVVIKASLLRKVCDTYGFDKAEEQNLFERTHPFVLPDVPQKDNLRALLVDRPSALHIGLPQFWRSSACAIWKESDLVKFDHAYFNQVGVIKDEVEEKANSLRQHMTVYAGRIGLKMPDVEVPEMRHAQIYYNADTGKHWLVIGDVVEFFQVRTTHLNQERLGKQAATSFVEGNCDYVECASVQDAELKLAQHYKNELERLA